MACKNCKDTPKLTPEQEKEFGDTPLWMIRTFYGMIILSLYGLYSLFSFLISLF